MTRPLDEVYRALRNAAPVLWNESNQSWALFRYGDVQSALRNPAFSSAARVSRMLDASVIGTDLSWWSEMMASQLETCDVPDHTRLRSAIAGPLHNEVGAAAGSISATVAGLASRINWAEPVDLVDQIATPLPLAVIIDVLGFEEREHATIAALVDDIVHATTSVAPDGHAAYRQLLKLVSESTTGLVGNLR